MTAAAQEAERVKRSCPCGKWTGDGKPCRDCKRKEHAADFDRLTAIMGEPVLPLSVVCEAVRTWADASEQGFEVKRALNVSISKSGLMFRLLFWGEQLRTERCEYHKGKMDTGLWILGGLGCCDGSGWLEHDVTRREERKAHTLKMFSDPHWGDGQHHDVKWRIESGEFPADYMERVFGATVASRDTLSTKPLRGPEEG